MNADQILHIVLLHAAQIAVLVLGVALLVRATGRRRPWLAHGLWFLVLLKCVTPPLWGHSLGVFCHPLIAPVVSQHRPVQRDTHPVSHAVVPGPAVPAATELETVSATVVTTVSKGATTNHETGLQPVEPQGVWSGDWRILLLLFLGATGLLRMMFLVVRCGRWLRNVTRQRNTELEARWQTSVTRLANQLKVRSPRLSVSSGAAGPAVAGLFRPVIVLPERLLLQHSENALRPIVAHELLHIRRNDLWTGCLQAVVQCVWWFHPAVRIAARAMVYDAERCCDEQVLAELNCSPAEYAKSLLLVMEDRTLEPAPMFPGVKPVELTQERMERIMSLTHGCRTRTPWMVHVAVVLLALLILPGAARSTPDSTFDEIAAAPSPQNAQTNEEPGTVEDEKAEAGTESNRGLQSEEESLRNKLTQTVSFECRDEAPMSVIRRLSGRFEMNVVIARSCTAVMQKPCTVKVQDVELHTLLSTFCDSYGLVWEVGPEVISISHYVTQDYDISEYNISDVAFPSSEELHRGGGRNDPAASLIALIRSSVRPDSWGEHSRIRHVRHAGVLRISQTASGHRRIRELLAGLRSNRVVQTRLILIRMDPTAVPKLGDLVQLSDSSAGCAFQILSASDFQKFWTIIRTERAAASVHVDRRLNGFIGSETTFHQCVDPNTLGYVDVRFLPDDLTSSTSLEVSAKWDREGGEPSVRRNQMVLRWGNAVLLDVSRSGQGEVEERLFLILTPTPVGGAQTVKLQWVDESPTDEEELNGLPKKDAGQLLLALTPERSDGLPQGQTPTSTGTGVRENKHPSVPTVLPSRADEEPNQLLLRQPVTVRCQDSSLQDVISHVTEQHGINIVILPSALQNEAAKTGDRRYSLAMKAVPLESFLNAICVPRYDLGWEICEGGIQIVPYLHREYIVGDLCVPRPRRTVGQPGPAAERENGSPAMIGFVPDLRPLMEEIRKTVRPRSWQHHASMTMRGEDDHVLRIRQTPQGHAQIQEILDRHRGDAPTMAEVLAALRQEVAGTGQSVPDGDSDDVRIATELIAGWTVEPQVYPLIGPAWRRHRRYQCTVSWEESRSGWWPIPFTHQAPVEQVVYIARDHFVRAGTN